MKEREKQNISPDQYNSVYVYWIFDATIDRMDARNATIDERICIK